MYQKLENRNAEPNCSMYIVNNLKKWAGYVTKMEDHKKIY